MGDTNRMKVPNNNFRIFHTRSNEGSNLKVKRSLKKEQLRIIRPNIKSTQFFNLMI